LVRRGNYDPAREIFKIAIYACEEFSGGSNDIYVKWRSDKKEGEDEEIGSGPIHVHAFSHNDCRSSNSFLHCAPEKSVTTSNEGHSFNHESINICSTFDGMV